MTTLQDEMNEFNSALDEVERILEDLKLSMRNVRDNSSSAANLAYVIEDLTGISITFEKTVRNHKRLMDSISILLRFYKKYGDQEEALNITVTQN